MMKKERIGAARGKSKGARQSSVEYSNQNGQLNLKIDNTGFCEQAQIDVAGERRQGTNLEAVTSPA